jgi:FeS assembly SUF system protein
MSDEQNPSRNPISPSLAEAVRQAAAEPSPAPPAAAAPPAQNPHLESAIVDVLKTIFDPEIPVNIYELGLIYDILADSNGVVGIRMTLTAPSCPSAQTLPVEVQRRVAEIPEVTDAKVDVVWEPPWDKDRMSEAAKLQLGMF